MEWRYRIAYKDELVGEVVERTFGMVEYFPDVLGSAAWSGEFEAPLGENIDDLRGALRNMLEDLESETEPFDINSKAPSTPPPAAGAEA